MKTKEKRSQSEINYEALVRCFNHDCEHCPMMESYCDEFGTKFGYVRLPLRLIEDIKNDEGYMVHFDGPKQ